MAEPTTGKAGDHHKWLFLPSCFPLLVAQRVLVHGLIPLQGQDFPLAVMTFLPTHFSPNHPLVLEVTNVRPWPPRPSPFPGPAGADAASPSVGTAGPSGSDPGPAVPWAPPGPADEVLGPHWWGPSWKRKTQSSLWSGIADGGGERPLGLASGPCLLQKASPSNGRGGCTRELPGVFQPSQETFQKILKQSPETAVQTAARRLPLLAVFSWGRLQKSCF